MLVFANKQDINGALTSAEIRTVSSIIPAFCDEYRRLTLLQALDLDGIKSHQWSIMSCSAVTGYNIVEGINWVVEDVAERLYYGATSGSAPPLAAQPPPSAQRVTS